MAFPDFACVGNESFGFGSLTCFTYYESHLVYHYIVSDSGCTVTDRYDIQISTYGLYKLMWLMETCILCVRQPPPCQWTPHRRDDLLVDINTCEIGS